MKCRSCEQEIVVFETVEYPTDTAGVMVNLGLGVERYTQIRCSCSPCPYRLVNGRVKWQNRAVPSAGGDEHAPS